MHYQQPLQAKSSDNWVGCGRGEVENDIAVPTLSFEIRYPSDTSGGYKCRLPVPGLFLNVIWIRQYYVGVITVHLNTFGDFFLSSQS